MYAVIKVTWSSDYNIFFETVVCVASTEELAKAKSDKLNQEVENTSLQYANMQAEAEKWKAQNPSPEYVQPQRIPVPKWRFPCPTTEEFRIQKQTAIETNNALLEAARQPLQDHEQRLIDHMYSLGYNQFRTYMHIPPTLGDEVYFEYRTIEFIG